MKYLSLLAIAAASLVAAQSLDKQFTVNLLTKEESLSIVKLDIENQTPLSFNDAPIKHVYDKTIYSVLASFTFDAKGAGQRFNIDNDQWSVNINMSLLNAGDETVTHQDVEIGKKPEDSTQFWFDSLPDKVNNVDLDMPQEGYTLKGTQ